MNICEEYLSEDEKFYIDIHTNWQIIDYFNNFYETFNIPPNVKVIEKSKSKFITSFEIKDSFITTFEINDIKYIFISEIKDKAAIILFYPLDDEMDIFKERKTSGYIGILFGSLIQSVRLMLKEYDINTIGFTAENKKLEGIYNLLSTNKNIQKRFPDWELKDIVKNNQGKLNYTYIRKD